MNRNATCEERIDSAWQSRLEDFQRFHDAACERGIFDIRDSDYDDAGVEFEDTDAEFPWRLVGPDGDIDSYRTEAEAEEALKTYRHDKGLDVDTGERPSRERFLEEFYEYGLSFDYVVPYTFKDQDRGYWRYQLSWGGPSDEIRFYGDYVSEYRVEMSYAEYWFLDWYQGASRRVRGPVIDYIWDQFAETGTAGHQYQEAMKDYEPPVDEDEEENQDD